MTDYWKSISIALHALSLLLLITLAIYFFQTKERLVYVDSAKLINTYKGMQDARKEFQNKTAVYKANIDTLVKEVKTRISNYEQEKGKMSVRERELTEELLVDKERQLSDYQQAIAKKVQEEDAQLTKRVIEEINIYLRQYGKDNHYTVIFGATEYGNIIYAEDFLDITNKVLEGLNKNYIRK
ncbi:MAG: OmpH family outer membrane protein [Chitinophagales bacterium]